MNEELVLKAVLLWLMLGFTTFAGAGLSSDWGWQERWAGLGRWWVIVTIMIVFLGILVA